MIGNTIAAREPMACMAEGGDRLTDEHRHAVSELDRHITAFNQSLRENGLADETLETVGPLLGDFTVEEVRDRIEARREKAAIICNHLMDTDLDNADELDVEEGFTLLDSVFEQTLEAF